MPRSPDSKSSSPHPPDMSSASASVPFPWEGAWSEKPRAAFCGGRRWHTSLSSMPGVDSDRRLLSSSALFRYHCPHASQCGSPLGTGRPGSQNSREPGGQVFLSGAVFMGQLLTGTLRRVLEAVMIPDASSRGRAPAANVPAALLQTRDVPVTTSLLRGHAGLWPPMLRSPSFLSGESHL